jgi:hypothetical protein
MRLYRILRALGTLALLATAWLAHAGLPELTAPELLRIAGVALPALALVGLGRSLKRAQKALAAGTG